MESEAAQVTQTLTTDNYSAGFLIDEELMGGVTAHPKTVNTYIGYVLRHTTGEYLGYELYTDLGEALAAINQVRRPWKYEQAGGCGSGNCGKGGGSCAVGAKGAAGGRCGKKSAPPETSPVNSQTPTQDCC